LSPPRHPNADISPCWGNKADFLYFLGNDMEFFCFWRGNFCFIFYFLQNNLLLPFKICLPVSPLVKGPARLIRSGGEWIPARQEQEDEGVKNQTPNNKTQKPDKSQNNKYSIFNMLP
jgi:hypothetical protein